jgi:YlmC/YmxH family sporulation protein
MKISDFQTKDVINIVDGKKLGQITDIELDLRIGRIESIVVPSNGRFFGFFGGGTDVVIPWRSIVKIGADVVLVKLDDPKLYRSGDERLKDGTRSFRDRDRDRDRDRSRDRDLDRDRERDRERYRDDSDDDDYR